MATPRIIINRITASRATRYTNFACNDTLSNELTMVTPWSCPGTFDKLRIERNAALGTGRTRTTMLRTGSAPGSMSDSGLTAAITDGGAPSADDLIHSAHLNSGEYLSWRIGCDSSVAGSDDLSHSVNFTPDTDGDAGWSWSTRGNNGNSGGTRYSPLFQGQTSTLGASTVMGDILAVPGQLLRIDIWLDAAPGAAASGKGYRFTVLRSTNAGLSYTALDGSGGTPDSRFTIMETLQAGFFSGAVDGAIGELYLLKIDPINSPNAASIACSTWFRHSTPNAINFFGTTLNSPTSAGTTYSGAINFLSWNATEAARKIQAGITRFILQHLIVATAGAPGASPVTYTQRKNEATPTGAATVVLTGAEVTDSDDGDGIIYESGDFFAVQCVAAGATGNTSFAFQQSLVIPAIIAVTKHVIEIGIDEDEDLDDVTECTGGGEVAEAENPADGVSLATTSAPLYWMEVTLNDGSPATVYRWAQMAIPYGLPKEARVLRFGTLTRALSDIDGGFQSATITSELQDIDGVIRAAWVSGTLRGARVDYYCADLATLQAGGSPDRRFRGYISKCEPSGDRTFRLTVEDALTNILNAIDGQDLQSPRELIEDRLADLSPRDPSFDKAMPLLFGSISDEFGAWQTTHSGTAEDDGVLLEWFLVSMGVVIVNEAFLAGLGATADVRVQVSDEAFALGRPFVPGMPGWIEPNDWSERDNRRVTMVAGRADDPAIILAKEGTIPLVVNVCGLVADQSLSSSPNGTVNSPALALLLYMNNYLVQDALTDFLPILMDGDVPIFDTDSFNAVHDALVAMADTGYEPAIAGALGGDFQQRSWRDRVAEFCKSFGYDIGINHHGQAILSILDTTQGGSVFSFNTDTILEGPLRFPARLPVENEIRYVHTQNYLTPLGLLTPEPESRLPRDTVSSQWLSGMQVVRDQASIDALGGSPRGRRRSAVQEYTLSRNAAQSAAVAGRRRDLLSPPNGRLEVAIPLSIKHGCELELGQVGDAEHWDLPWQGSRRCRIVQLEEDMDGLTITPVLRDSEDLLP